MTLPLSYSRLIDLVIGSLGDWVAADCPGHAQSHHPKYPITQLPNYQILIGGEGRTRTFEAARATDLQSAAFDRFATSPTLYVCVESLFSARTLQTVRSSLELAKGFEPPTR